MSDITLKPSADLRPLDLHLSVEIRDWVCELRTIWAASGWSINRFARLHPIADKGTISRYLNGQRVPRESWFLDQLLAIQTDDGKPVSPEVREHLTKLHLRALQAAHPHEYRVRLIQDQLQIAHTAKLEAERYARSLEEQLAERNRRIQELADEEKRLRAAWNADHVDMQAEYSRLTEEINALTGELYAALGRATQAEQRCQQLEDLLERLDALAPTGEDNISERFIIDDRIQAFAVVFDTTPDAVVREACNFFLSEKIETPEYREALEAYHRRTSDPVAILEEIKFVK